uniref:Uncharacterized protein n=1 Tax=viral metagenome TaxID=1070528 RepID=A0A6C0F7Y7_9ZZZZ|tara:strand:+ start:158 stop:409 length:252 start_codon:yes stop_codon:yes gene_type:complete
MAALRRSLKRMSRSKSQRRSAKKTRKLKRGTKKSPRKGKSKGKNEFMKKRNAALRSGKSSFTYCGKTYKKVTLKTGLETYKRA